MVDYKKLYATLVGRVDDALQHMVGNLNDPARMLETAEMLRRALQEAEDAYVTAEEDED